MIVSFLNSKFLLTKIIRYEKVTSRSTNNLSSGIYFIQVQTDKGISTQKTIKK